MTTEKDGGSAFPAIVPGCGHGSAIDYQEGMSLRDWFAGQALAVLATYAGEGDFSEPENDKCVATIAYGIADAMLEARKGKLEE